MYAMYVHVCSVYVYDHGWDESRMDLSPTANVDIAQGNLVVPTVLLVLPVQARAMRGRK